MLVYLAQLRATTETCLKAVVIDDDADDDALKEGRIGREHRVASNELNFPVIEAEEALFEPSSKTLHMTYLLNRCALIQWWTPGGMTSLITPLLEYRIIGASHTRLQ
jgi:hypothetical protein